jgi:chemotaxis signal transduction protein
MFELKGENVVNTKETAKMPWVITELRGQLFAFNAASVREMVIMPEVAPVPGVPEYMRGVMNLRGHVIPVVDLRRRLGMPSSAEDLAGLCSLMEQRAQDHRHWIDELEASVRENRKFALATDPHQCAFGKWYDKFQSNNLIVAGFLKKFAAPHARVHALAAEIEQYVREGHTEDAHRRIQNARSVELSEMLQLFQAFPEMIRTAHAEIAVVLDGANSKYAVCVDSVVEVERFAEGAVEKLEGSGLQLNGALSSVAKRSKGKSWS